MQMFDTLVSAALWLLAYSNSNAGLAQYQHNQLPPASNQFVCRQPRRATNHDLCDRQGGNVDRGGD